MFEIDECPVAPDFGEQLLAGHQLARLLQQEKQNLEGLFGQPHSRAMFEEFARRGVHFKWTESQPGWGFWWSQHANCEACITIAHGDPEGQALAFQGRGS
jgi:hypothetical protein